MLSTILILPLILQLILSTALSLPTDGAILSTALNLTLPLSAHDISFMRPHLPNFHPQYFKYDVPNTNRFVGMIVDTDQPTSPRCIQRIITEILADVQHHIATHGDGPLAPEENPYDLEVASQETSGCYISVEGRPGQEVTLLTYGMLVETAIALQHILARRYMSSAVDFVIEGRDGTKYGFGRLAPTFEDGM